MILNIAANKIAEFKIPKDIANHLTFPVFNIPAKQIGMLEMERTPPTIAVPMAYITINIAANASPTASPAFSGCSKTPILKTKDKTTDKSANVVKMLTATTLPTYLTGFDEN